MTHFLDTLPFDWTDPAARELRDFLANTYHRQERVEVLVVESGIKVGTITWHREPNLLWHDVLTKARNQDRLRSLLTRIKEGDDAAVATRIDEFLGDAPVIDAVVATTTAPPEWKGFDNRDELERLIVEDRNTLLDIVFLERGLALAPAVCRLRVQHTKRYHGTAFRIGPNLLLTNHHVLYDWDHGDTRAISVEIWFGYERDFAGNKVAHAEYTGDLDSIDGDKAQDWAVVRVAEPLSDEYPILSLDQQTPVAKDDRVYIIQHPDGGPKQIGMHHNLVRHTDENVIQYWTDTTSGSSGSPVYNNRWEIVALHHRWVEVEANGRTEYRNQGRRIERIREGLQGKGLL